MCVITLVTGRHDKLYVRDGIGGINEFLHAFKGKL